LLFKYPDPVAAHRVAALLPPFLRRCNGFKLCQDVGVIPVQKSHHNPVFQQLLEITSRWVAHIVFLFLTATSRQIARIRMAKGET